MKLMTSFMLSNAYDSSVKNSKTLNSHFFNVDCNSVHLWLFMCNLAITNPSNVGFPQTTFGKILVYKYSRNLDWTIHFSLFVSVLRSVKYCHISPQRFHQIYSLQTSCKFSYQFFLVTKNDVSLNNAVTGK